MDILAINGGTPVRSEPYPAWPIAGDLEEKLVLEVVRARKWGGTSRLKLQELEEKFAQFQDARHAISVTNGTLAITVALKAAGIQPGDEVITSPYTFIATATAALLFGAIPVFVDVEEDTLLLDTEKIVDAITPKTKAIIAVHVGGAPANLSRLKEIADQYQLRLIEDSAQAVGAEWNGTRVGAIGDLGTFSFQSSKNLNSGEGGIIITNSREFADKAWSLANVGRIRDGAWYQHECVGWNLRMTEFRAAILLAQMTRLTEQYALREQNSTLLTELLSEIEGVRLLKSDPRITRHANHLYMFCLERELSTRVDKSEVINALQAEGIPVSAGYVSLNLNSALQSEVRKWLGESRFYSCPVSERMSAREVLWLPQNTLLGNEKDVHDISVAVKKVLRVFVD